jgi:hypothetical protein
MSLERSEAMQASQLRAYVIASYKEAMDDYMTDDQFARSFGIADADDPLWPTDGEWVEEMDYDPLNFDLNVPDELGPHNDEQATEPIVRDGNLLYVYANDGLEQSYTKFVQV